MERYTSFSVFDPRSTNPIIMYDYPRSFTSTLVPLRFQLEPYEMPPPGDLNVTSSYLGRSFAEAGHPLQHWPCYVTVLAGLDQNDRTHHCCYCHPRYSSWRGVSPFDHLLASLGHSGRSTWCSAGSGRPRDPHLKLNHRCLLFGGIHIFQISFLIIAITLLNSHWKIPNQ